jgi:hypothetical protein
MRFSSLVGVSVHFHITVLFWLHLCIITPWEISSEKIGISHHASTFFMHSEKQCLLTCNMRFKSHSKFYFFCFGLKMHYSIPDWRK